MSILTYNEKEFLLNGKPFTIVSGAMHYFRIPRAMWHDRLLKLKECGFNTVETYMPWNLHEKRKGEFDFTGILDVAAYAAEAKALGLHMILRPGPYICAEWDFGGLPSWLLREEGIALRTMDPRYLSLVEKYYQTVFQELMPHMASNGGAIFMVQIENEYGSYGDDHEYMQRVADIYRECGVKELLYTADGACMWMLSGGTLPTELCVANFGSHPEENFAALEQFRPRQPKMCGEYWCGWFDHWYEEHHVREPKELSELHRDMLRAGASLNFYMFHGGTNFGFLNGANHDGEYRPTVTSYDYNALLSEAGDRTEAYYMVRDINREFFGSVPPLTAEEQPKKAYGRVELTEFADLWEVAPSMAKTVHSPVPLTQEKLGQCFGYTLYRSVLQGPREPLPLVLESLHDRAVIRVNGEFRGIVERDRRQDEVTIDLAAGEEAVLEILVENMGRINYGPQMGEEKGLAGVRLGQQKHFSWDCIPLEMEPEQLAAIPFRKGAPHGNSFFARGILNLEEEPADSFLRLDGFTHGFAAVNGINLGRYYNPAGPQKTLYVPASFLHKGENEILICETDGATENFVTLTDRPEL